jgi:hypothetical protein
MLEFLTCWAPLVGVAAALSNGSSNAGFNAFTIFILAYSVCNSFFTAIATPVSFIGHDLLRDLL